MSDMKSAAHGGEAEFSSIDTLSIQPRQNRGGLLGGTFNPVHNGHIRMAYIAMDEFLLGEVVFIPLGVPPHKRNQHIASAEHRLAMLHLAIGSEKRFSVDTIEITRTGFTYTVDTLEALCKVHPDTDYYYIIGADTLYELHAWRNFERVIMMTRFICVLRPGVEDGAARDYAKELNVRYGERVFVAREKGPDISSSLIRDMAAGNRIASGLMPENVAQYIRLNRIYIQGD
jgi:nicotinate-nucleotide adenylyltransferase